MTAPVKALRAMPGTRRGREGRLPGLPPLRTVRADLPHIMGWSTLCALCGESAYVVRCVESPVVLGIEAGAHHIIRAPASAYREARKDINALSACQLDGRLVAGSDPVTAHVSSA